MNRDEQVLRNLDLAESFLHEVIDAPEMLDDIPDRANIILIPSDDNELADANEVGRIRGVVFVDDDGNPLPPYDPSRCTECGLGEDGGTHWDSHQFWPYGSLTRWRCPCGNAWVN